MPHHGRRLGVERGTDRRWLAQLCDGRLSHLRSRAFCVRDVQDTSEAHQSVTCMGSNSEFFSVFFSTAQQFFSTTVMFTRKTLRSYHIQNMYGWLTSRAPTELFPGWVKGNFNRPGWFKIEKFVVGWARTPCIAICNMFLNMSHGVHVVIYTTTFFMQYYIE